MKIFWIIFIWVVIVILTIYPVSELTCAIVNQEIVLRLHPEIPLDMFYWEIGLMWLGYIVAMLGVFISLAVNFLRGK